MKQGVWTLRRLLVAQFLLSVIVFNGLVTVAAKEDNLALQNEWRTIQFETNQVTAPDIVLSPNGEWMIFTMVGKLFRLPVKGGEAEQLTFGPHYDNDPAISPDGKLVAFESDRDGSNGNIFVLDLATREIRQVTREIWADRPAWSPDGKTIAYLRLDRSSWRPREVMIRPPAEIRRVKLEGGDAETLREKGEFFSVFFLPDGRLAWTQVEELAAPRRVTTKIQAIGADKNVTTLRTFDALSYPVLPHPNEGFYVWNFKLDWSVRELVFATTSEGKDRRITYVSGEQNGFALSKDNATIYVGNHGHLWKVTIVNGRREFIPFKAKVTMVVRPRTLPSTWTPPSVGTVRGLRAIREPRLSPDGSKAVFQALGDIWEQLIGGAIARQVTEGEGIKSNPVFSPEGSQLAFIRSVGNKEEIQVLEFKSSKTRTVAPATECGYEQMSWSRHGELIAATACDHDIIAIDPQTASMRVLVPKVSDWEPSPYLAADGKTLYYQAELKGSKPSLYRLRLESGEKAEAIKPASWDGPVEINENRIAEPVRNQTGIIVSSLNSGDKSEDKKILKDADGHQFSFLPDGSGLLYVAGNKLFRQFFGDGLRKEIPIRIEKRIPSPPPVFIDRVRILDYAAGGFTEEKSLLLENGRISWIGKAGKRRLPAGTIQIDGAGRYAIPGLFDNHGHGSGCGGVASIANGVTSVRNMGGVLEAQNAFADRSDLTGEPLARCFYSGRILEGAQGRVEDFYFVHPENEEEARNYVRRWKEQGVHFIKLYERLPWTMQRAASEEARRLGLPVEAHGNRHEWAVKGVISGYTGLTHWELGYHDDMIQMFKVTGTRWEPTLPTPWGNRLLYQNEPERFPAQFPQIIQLPAQISDLAMRGGWNEKLRTMNLAYRQGITFLPGTDAVPEGLSLQWALEFHSQAGIPPLEVLRLATQVSAKELGAEKELGTIEAGKLADLILLDANPLEDIKNTQKIYRVFKGGWMFDPKVLQPNRN